MDWIDINKDVRKTTRSLRNGQTKKFGIFLLKKGLDIIDANTFKILTMDQIYEFIELYKDNTKISYLDMIAALVDHFNGSSKLQKSILEARVRFKTTAVSSVKAVKIDDAFLLEVKEKVAKTNDRNMKIFGEMMLNNLTGIRIDDAVNTRLSDDGSHSFLDMEKKKWIIRSVYTKNNKARVFDIPEDFILKVKKYSRGDWLISTKLLEKYCSSQPQREKFKKFFGFSYGQSRKGQTDNVHEQDSMEETKKNANMLGHSVRTELLHYVESTPEVNKKKRIRIKKKKDLILMKGLPGSGKSTKARELGGLILSTDDYWMKSGKYEFDMSKVCEGHLWNQKRCDDAMKKGVTRIIIDNCNLDDRSRGPYKKLADMYGYNVKIETPETPWEDDPVKCFDMCVHKVPLHTIKRMVYMIE